MNRDLLLNLRLDAMKAIDISNADDSAFKELARVLIPDSEKDDNKVFGPFMEKFAELIVQECIDIAYEYDEPKLSGPGMIIGNRIEQHFGVEE